MKVISFKICPFVQRVTALLAAKQINYEVEYIDLMNKPQWFLNISPNGQVPVLITDSDQVLFESDAIVEYLEEIYPPLEKDISPEQRARNRAWSYLGIKNYLVQCNAQRSPDQVTLNTREDKLKKAFLSIEKVLKPNTFFNGTSINMVDIAWLPILHRAALIESGSGYDFLKDFPKCKQWQKLLLSTGLAEKSVAKILQVNFSHFILQIILF